MHSLGVVVYLEEEEHVVLLNLGVITLDEGIDVADYLVSLHANLRLIDRRLIVLVHVQIAL